MPAERKISDADKSLAISLAEPKARRKVAKAAGIPSGALPILAGLVYRHRIKRNCRPRTLYGAGIASESLVRAYLRRLIQLELVYLERRNGRRFLHPSLKGLAVATEYGRQMRAGTQAFSQA